MRIIQPQIVCRLRPRHLDRNLHPRAIFFSAACRTALPAGSSIPSSSPKLSHLFSPFHGTQTCSPPAAPAHPSTPERPASQISACSHPAQHSPAKISPTSMTPPPRHPAHSPGAAYLSLSHSSSPAAAASSDRLKRHREWRTSPVIVPSARRSPVPVESRRVPSSPARLAAKWDSLSSPAS